LHHTINRTWAAAALPSVIGEPGCDFTGVAAVLGAGLVLARALRVSAVVPVAARAVLRATSRGNTRRQWKAVVFDDCVEFSEKCRRFLVVKSSCMPEA
jgi:hypothetical protein